MKLRKPDLTKSLASELAGKERQTPAPAPTSAQESLDPARRERLRVSSGLLVRLRRKMLADGLLAHDVAAKIGMSYTHLLALLGGHRPAASLEKPKLEALARLLDTSVVQVMYWAGILKADDFVVETRLSSQLQQQLEAMRDDPAFAPLAPTQTEWIKMPATLRLKVMEMYARLCRQNLIEMVEFEPDARVLRQIIGVPTPSPPRTEQPAAQPKRPARLKSKASSRSSRS